MKQIDKTFLDVLFIDKKVKKGQRYYDMFFRLIWPKVDAFEKFLSESDNEIKIDAAKEIYQSLILINEFFIPEEIVLKVLDGQCKNFAENNKEYIQQDHFIHSINTYILGIYLIFNSEIFYNKLFENKLHIDEIKRLIKKWQLAALYHDIGYYVEPKSKEIESATKKETSKKTDIRFYENIEEQLLGQLIIKDYTLSVLLISLPEQNINLQNILDGISKDYFLEDEWWIKINNELCCLNQYQKLPMVNNDFDYELLSPVLSEKFASVVYNKDGVLVAIYIRSCDGIRCSYCISSDLKNKLVVGGGIDASIIGGYLEYYANKKEINTFGYMAQQMCHLKLPENIKLKIDIGVGDIYDVYEEIFLWISKKIKLSYDFYRFKGDYVISLILKEINEQAKHILNNTSKKSLKTIFMELGEQIKSWDDKQIKLKIGKEYDKTYGGSADLISDYQAIFNKIRKRDDFLKLKKELKIFHKNKNEYVLKALHHKSDALIQHELYQKIESFSNRMIEFNSLKNYRLSFMFCDHGIATAALLYKIACYVEELKEIARKTEGLFLFNIKDNEETERKNAIADVIFSIMVHNVYSTNASQDVGAISYKHNIVTHPFAYFLSLCDNVQKWGREKKINQAKIKLPYYHYLEDDIDLKIAPTGEIVVFCLEKNKQAIQHCFDEVDLYMPGFTQIVKVKEI